MANDTITTKFKVDISDLKKGITEANKQIKLANAEFKAATSGMDSWAKSSEGIGAKLKQLQTVLNNQVTKLKAYKDQLKAIEDAESENGKRADELKAKLQQLADQGVSETSEEYKKYKKALTDVEKEQAANEKAAEGLRVTILNQQAAVDGTVRDMRKWNSALQDVEDEQKQSESATGKLTDEISKQQDELDKLKRKYKDTVLEQGKNSDAAKELADEIEDLSGELRENQTRLKGVDDAADDLDNSLDDVEGSAQDAGDGFTVMKGALANLIADGFRKAIDACKELAKEIVSVGASFDSSMAQVAAVSGASADEIDALRQKAKDMGASTKFTATEAADAFNYMAMAGWKTEDMLEGIDGVLNLAAASGADLATTSDIVTDALTAMGYKAGDAGKLADVMAAASSNANTNVEMMGATFQYAAPLVGALGYNMEDTAVAIGLMANAGIKGEKAGTALRSIFTRLAAPPKAAATAMEELGLSLTDSSGKMKPFNEVMEDMRKAFADLDETEQTEMASKIAGQEAMSGLLSIVNAAPEDFAKLTKAVDNSAGSASKMSEIMLDNVGGDFTLLKSQFEGVQIQIYEKLAPALRDGMAQISEALASVDWDAFGEKAGKAVNKVVDVLTWIVKNKDGIVTALKAIIAAFAAAKIIAAATAIAGFITKIKTLTETMGLLKAVMTAIGLTPTALIIAGIVAAVAALVAGIILLIKNWDKVKAVAEKVWNKIKAIWEPIGEWFGQILAPVIEWFGVVWEKIKAIWEPVKQFFVNLWNGIVESLKPLIEAITGAFREGWELIKVIWDLVKPYFEGIWNGIQAVFSVVKTILSGFFGAAWEAIKGIWDGVKAYFELVWTGIKAVFSVVTTWFKGLFKTAWEAIKLVWDAVVGYFTLVWEGIKTVFKVVKSVLSGDFKGAWEAIKALWDKVKGYFSGIWDGIKSVFSAVKDWFKSTFSAAWDAIKSVFSGVGTFFSSIWDTIKKTFTNIGQKVGETMSSVFKSAINGLLSAAEKVLNAPIKAINTAIGLLNDVPGVSIGKLSEFSLPRMAQGGVLKKGQIGFLEGDGTEAVVPLERNREWIKKVAAEMSKQFGLTEAKANAVSLTSGMSRNLSRTFQSSSVSHSTVNNFNQVINAPKPLTRIELYRQTKNLLALKGV